jgi:CMP-2-keto-3-deoxyoctulosonic acid synthetase
VFKEIAKTESESRAVSEFQQESSSQLGTQNSQEQMRDLYNRKPVYLKTMNSGIEVPVANTHNNVSQVCSIQ